MVKKIFFEDEDTPIEFEIYPHFGTQPKQILLVVNDHDVKIYRVRKGRRKWGGHPRV